MSHPKPARTPVLASVSHATIELAAYTRSDWSPLASAFLDVLKASDWQRRAM